jgi:hypothetical protein
MIYSTRLTTTSPTEVFYSTTSGGDVGESIPGGATALPIDTAVTNIMICNTGTPNLTDETVNSTSITIHLVNTINGSPSDTNAIVKNLIVPAGETVFFSDEKIVLRGDSDYGTDIIYVTAADANLISVTVSALPV